MLDLGNGPVENLDHLNLVGIVWILVETAQLILIIVKISLNYTMWLELCLFESFPVKVFITIIQRVILLNVSPSVKLLMSLAFQL